MKKIVTTLVAILWVPLVYAQTFPVGRGSATVIDEARGNRQIPIDLFYPATANGVNVPVADDGNGFPLVTFGHGFLISTSAYNWLGDSLARNGFIVALPASEGGLLPSHGEFGADLSFVVSKVLGWNADPASPFFNRIIQRAAVAGHSMGGGASFLAAAGNNSGIKALFNFAAAETNPSAISAAAQVNVPSLIISGSRDCIVPPSTQLSMFQNIPSGNCKFYVNITDALHCQFANNNFTCATGQLFSGCNSSPITLPNLYSSLSSLLIPFLNFHLKEQCIEGERFRVLFNSFVATNKEQQCPPPPGCGVVPVKLKYFTGTFHRNKNHLQWETEIEESFSFFEIYKSNNGSDFQQLARVEATGSGPNSNYRLTDQNPFASKSFYRLKMVDRDNQFTWSPVISILSRGLKSNEIIVHPNPINDQLQIHSQEKDWKEGEIINSTGQTMRRIFPRQLTPGNIKIDVNDLGKGVYYLRLKGLNGISASARFVKL